MHKLSYQQSGKGWVPHSYAPIFTTETTSAETQRLVAGVPGGDVSVMLKLIECLTPPFLVLYVLHTPRGEGDPGRYQSPPIEPGELQTFISRFSSYFAGDARFDIWIHSSTAKGTLIWDRHNLIYGYGPIERFNRSLSGIGFSEGKPNVPEPHMHHYRQELDAEATAMLSAFSWQYSPLHPEDEQ